MSAEKLDIFGIYKRDIHNEPRGLPLHVQIDLARKIQAGMTAESQMQLTVAKRNCAALADTVTRGQVALHSLINANVGVAIKIAQRYPQHWRHFDDLVQIGNIALIYAALSYKPWKRDPPVRFSTWAYRIVHGKVFDAVLNIDRTIPLPIDFLRDKVRVLNRANRSFRQDNHREPTDKELSNIVGWPEAEVTQVRVNSLFPVSLQQKTRRNGDGTLEDNLPDPRNIENTVIRRLRKQDVRKLLGELSGKHWFVIKYRFGLDGGESLTLEEIGDKLNLSRERIRQIESEALAILTCSDFFSENIMRLYDYLD